MGRARLAPRIAPGRPMKTITLLRHAKSSWTDPGLRDFDRPLNDRGKRDLPRMAARFVDKHDPPELIVSSPAKRARKTARGFAKGLGLDKGEVCFEDLIYEAFFDTLLEVIWSLDDSLDDVMLVGHNPGFTELCEWLSGAGIANMPTCALARIELGVERWRDVGRGSGSLADFDYPKKEPV